jgi:hypothetical protein
VACALLVAVAAVACEGNAPRPPPSVTPAVSPSATASPTEHAPTLEPLPPVTFTERVTFYGAEPGDAAMALASGDFNGDDAMDVALAAAFADGPENARPDGGEAYVFFGPFSPGETRDAAQGEQDVTVYGAGAGDQTGRAVAAADFDGDGLDDLALGAPFGDGPDDERTDAGETSILFGRPSWPTAIDLATEPATRVFGADPEDLAGFSLAPGDFNGDGVEDLLAGAFWADGPANSRPNAGEAYVVYGSSTRPEAVDLASNEQDVTVYGAEADDRLTEGMAAGDVSGDGKDDLLLAATFGGGPDNRSPKAGEVHVILGGQLAASYDLARTPGDIVVLGTDEGDQIGHSTAAGDVDGDGIGDLVLGAVSADGPGNGRDLAGEGYVVLGTGSAPTTIDTRERREALRLYGADSVDRLGRSAATADVNGDGRGDVLLAASGGDGADGSLKDAGEIYVLYGRQGLRGAMDLAAQRTDAVIEGLDANDVLGQNGFGRPSLLGADINGDGLGDVLVAALGDGPSNDRSDAGEAYILFAGR